MPSPFPGMDPWLERPGVFPDFHDGLLAALRAALNAVLPPPFYSSLAGRVWLEGGGQAVPDVQVVRGPGRAGRGGVATLEAPAAAPMVEIVAAWEGEFRENFVEVYGPGARLVASIELLSPANKSGEAREQYAAKQRELRDGGVHVLEIDLLRRGPHATLVPRASLARRNLEYDYHACLTRADRPGRHWVAPIPLSSPLPVLPVPLTGGVADAPLDLPAAFARTYEAALYARRVDYAQPCDPPLTAEQQAWAAGLLAAAQPAPPPGG